ncbi:MAG: acyl-CoA dehydrogenase family protein [Thermodesulfobacteriota bacterium]|nr:acyl-CoA dehydrogenase family protein [Thermodesulfobacteriota bacterium]
MDFDLTNEQLAIQKAVREFTKGEFDRDIAIEHELKHIFPRQLLEKACQHGFICIHFPEEYGGQGYNVLENILVFEEFCRQDSGFGVCLYLPTFGSELILRFGNEDQKKKFLRPLTKGKKISAAAFTEPDGGSDITTLSTYAEKKGDGYILNGTKTFISNGSICDYCIVLCQTDQDVRPGYKGQTLLIVEAGMEGFEATELENKMGIRMSSTAELNFNNVYVPPENVVGEENRGFYHSVEFFDESRLAVAALGLGIAQGAFDRALKYAQERKAFGKKIFEFQSIQHKLADMATKIETARLITYKASWNFDQGRIDPKLTSMAKMYASKISGEVAYEAIQIFGGYGYLLENEVERFYRDARITEIIEGTSEIQMNVISKWLTK